MYPQAHTSIYKIVPYVGGAVTPSEMVHRVMLASNENPFGCSPLVKSVLQSMLDCVHIYPSGTAEELKQAIAATHGLKANGIQTGSGSEELLHLLAKAYAGPGDEIISMQYGFMVYRIATLTVGATPIIVPQPDLSIDVEAILARVTSKTKIIFLDTPGNPLGGKLTKAQLRYLLDHLPESILLVVDAAYAEFAEDSDYTCGLEWVEEKPNLVVARTFSKIYGLAGLRVGWFYGPGAVGDVINRIRAPFNVNSLGQRAAIAALQDQEWLQKVKDHTIYMRSWMSQELEQLDLPFVPSFGNFILVNFSHASLSANEVYLVLGRRGIIVRPMTGYHLENHLRISIGTSEQMEELGAHLKDVLKNKQGVLSSSI
jgi:histidinol-phosphate aminotransferase